MLSVSCKKTLDINIDPNNPTSVAVSKLLTNAEQNLGVGLAIGGGNVGGLSQDLAVYTHQLTQRATTDQYGVTGDDYWIGQNWNGIYLSTLNNLEDVIAHATADGNMKYAGIAKILKAYAYSQMVDVYGDVPFTEANQFKTGVKYPKFDSGKDIYPALFTILDEGVANLTASAANKLTPGGDDVIYKGSVANWTKAANTIKLKLYTQTRLTSNVTAAVTALLANPANLINTTTESFLLPFGPNGATDDRNPGFNDYYAGQRSNYISPWFYEILKGYNSNINTGIVDPRIPYYIYNQTTAKQVLGALIEYRDSAFVSIYFGSIGADRDRSQQNVMSLMGIYPVGGRYDDGKGGAASSSSGTGAAPYRFITYADRLYLEAELIKSGVITGDARAKLQAAMTESFKQVDYVVSNFVKPSQTVPPLAGTTAVTIYINAVLAKYDAAPDKQLEIIMTEKWISSFGNAVDQFTDYRRTGFPILFDPNNAAMAPDHQVQPPINGDPAFPGANRKVPVQLLRPYPQSLPWYQNELETNPNAPKQKDPSNFKVFWKP
ncbi:MAG: SusD/RagB family nutrient-binding outer membrane lipoprotein [Bacteroidota bacterium]